MKMGDYKIIYEQWESRLNKNASENNLAALENTIIEWQKTADSMDKILVNGGHYYSSLQKVVERKGVRQKRALIEGLRELLNKYDNIEKPQKKEIRPVDQKDWIKKQFKDNRDKFDTQLEWAETTARKFKSKFKTSIGSPHSMLMYGNPEYEGLR